MKFELSTAELLALGLCPPRGQSTELHRHWRPSGGGQHKRQRKWRGAHEQQSGEPARITAGGPPQRPEGVHGVSSGGEQHVYSQLESKMGCVRAHCGTTTSKERQIGIYASIAAKVNLQAEKINKPNNEFSHPQRSKAIPSHLPKTSPYETKRTGFGRLQRNNGTKKR